MLLMTYTVPQPSNPRLWNIVTQNWKKKTKKNIKKLNELSLLKPANIKHRNKINFTTHVYLS